MLILHSVPFKELKSTSQQYFFLLLPLHIICLGFLLIFVSFLGIHCRQNFIVEGKLILLKLNCV